MQATPVTWRLLLDTGWAPPAGFTALCGGEKLPPDLAGRLCASGVRLWDLYGPTETTVWSSVAAIEDGAVRDFSAVANTTLYVLDDRLEPVPPGCVGELYIGGDGVALGYLGRPALTADRFVPDPYGPVAGRRIYRTGDVARRHPDGSIEVLGRTDNQVKLHGFRIEPGEIEACLADHPDVGAAVVTLHEPAPGQARLVGYVVAAGDARINLPDLRAHAATRLPGYMVPGLFMVVPALPLTPNGKVDRRALPPPDGPELDDYVAPRSDVEAAVAAIWAEVLDTARVGVHDNFFDLGGDSIRAVRLVGLLRAHGFGYAVRDVLRHQSVAALVRAGAGDATDAERAGTPAFALLDDADRATVPAGVTDAYPLAKVQAGMVYEMLADPGGRPYHNVTSYLLDAEPFDAAALTASTEAVVAAHEVLRTSFDLAGFTEPVQLVHARADVDVTHADLRGISTMEQDRALVDFRARERARAFDLARAPLIRVHTHRVDTGRWYLTLTECHAIVDGWSHRSIVDELLATYRAIRDRVPPPRRGTPAVRYADFVAQERRSLAGATDRAFWAGRLAGATRLTIPAAWADPDGPSAYSVLVPFGDVGTDLRALARLAGASLKSVLLAAHVAVWRAIAGAEPFHSGLVCNGRTEVDGGDRVAGMFLNPVPFVAPSGAATWRDLIRAVFDEEVELWPHRRFPLPEMQRVFGDGGRLLDVAFNYLDLAGPDAAGTLDDSPNEFPLAVSTQGENLVIRARSAAVGRHHAELLAAMYRRALTSMAADPAGNARRSLLPPAERGRLLVEGNENRAPRPDRGVHELFADNVAKMPHAVAVEAAGRRLTYRELHHRALHWATELRRAGIGAGDLVGLCLPREPELVAAMLGVLTAGAAYVPVDPRHPADRISALLRDAGVRTVISAAGPVSDADPDATVHHAHPDELAYVVHTSGSTGRPKGVMARHGALADRVWSMRRNLGLTELDVVAAVVPITTDVAQLATFVALAGGGRLVLADDDLARDPVSLANLLRDSGATFLQASPTTWRMLIESGWSPPAGFRVLSGGEAMSADLVRRLRATDADVWNMYGPSEATVFCFGTRLSGDATWVPAANTTTYLLDGDLEPVPFGVPGQIFVGGDGLARGYLGRPGSTADAFLPDPYTATAGGRMYATGDIGRRDHDGRIEILGRRDHQLKIRGFRVELGEIENTLTAHPGVRAAVVHPIPGPLLAAYVIVDGVTADELRGFAARTLPGYMVPTHFVTVESFPRLANGKIDRGALPVPDAVRPDVTTPYAPPHGPAEEAIAAVWAAALGIEKVGRDDDFFALGGHSLLTLRIIARLRQEHGIRPDVPRLPDQPDRTGTGRPRRARRRTPIATAGAPVARRPG